MKEKRNEIKHVDPQRGKTVFLLALRDIVSTSISDLCSIFLIDHIDKVIIILNLYTIVPSVLFLKSVDNRYNNIYRTM